jgi:hypothetical protein
MTTTCWNCKTEYETVGGADHAGNICPDCDCHQSIRDAALLEGKD